jgi:hypothetical protein
MGIWATGGLFMSLGWMLSTNSPGQSIALSTILGVIPIYTFMASAYDGSMFALLFISIVLFLAWVLPLSVGKTKSQPH